MNLSARLALVLAAFTPEEWEKVARPEPTTMWIEGVPGRRFRIYADHDTPVLGTTTTVNSEKIPNFVLPAWYVPGSAGPWDAGGVLQGPQSVTPGGYYLADDEGATHDVWSHPAGRLAFTAAAADKTSTLSQAVSQILAAAKGRPDWQAFHEERFAPPPPPPEPASDPAAES